MLLNALIAIMSDAATAAADTDGTKFLAAKADIIDELEQSIPQWHRGKDWCVIRGVHKCQVCNLGVLGAHTTAQPGQL